MKHLHKILLLFALMSSPFWVDAQRYAESSKLANGTIYKIGVTADGIYSISYSDLVAWGINPSSINTKKISLLGNLAGMLPENNSTENYDDLTEMNIIVEGGDDGSFDEDDAIIFYGQSPAVWNLSSGNYVHQTNYYSDTTFYFLKIDNQQDGLRIPTQQPPVIGDNYETITTFCDHQCHEIDLENHYKRGRKWYGETISGATSPTMTFPFHFDNVLKGSQGFVRFGFIGSSSSETFYVRFSVNDIQVMEDVRVPKAGSMVFGVEYDKTATFTAKNDDVNVKIEVIAENSSSFVGLDFIDVNVWRSLRYENDQLLFKLQTAMGHVEQRLVKIENSATDMRIFDVSNPLSPIELSYSLYEQVARFAISINEGAFIAATPSDYYDVVSCQYIDNQDVHSQVETYQADMVIITDKIFALQAEELRAFHEAEDDMNVAIAYTDEIYNEFSSGSLDITGIRNYIRMVNERSDRLKYVMLLGRGSCDYKNILGYSNNFVPPYEALNVTNELNAYVSDDYFGLMDDGEGETLTGKMDLGVGRIPVIDASEAETVVGKIRRYYDQSNAYGSWRNNMVLISDDNATYSKSCDALAKLTDTMQPTVNISKIYADSYVRQKQSDGSYRYPEATDEIMNQFSRGALMITYFGHGGVKGLSKSNLLKIDDITKLDNYYRLPFVATGTCEFSAFDDPTFVSAGERLFKMNDGGAIAMYTSTRPTMSGNNKVIMQNLYKNAFLDDRPRQRTFGDIALGTKQANDATTSNYVSYVLFGDPAMRLAYPKYDIVISEINDVVEKKDYVIGAMGNFEIECYVIDNQSNVDTSFNGVAYVKLFDNESRYATLNNSGDAGNHTFSFYSDVLFEGRVSVVNGSFTAQCVVPRTVNGQDAKARLSLYAFDTIRLVDATGCFENIKIDGVASTAVDFQGPDIQLLWNGTALFDNTFAANGTLTVKISDQQGIYHYGSVIGRDIMLTHSYSDSYETKNVNDLFEPALNDYTTGTLSVDFQGLEAGLHEFSVTAWDTHNNSNTASIVVEVNKNVGKFALVNVENSPNPFTDYTCFNLTCMKKSATFNAAFYIYDITGRLVNVLEYNNLTSGDNAIEWDGTDSYGNHLPAGVYIYNVCGKDSEGEVYSTTQKMILMR